MVNIRDRRCSCGRWQLSGISGPHAVSAIYFARQILEDFVDNCYRIAAYCRAYSPSIMAMSGPKSWPKSTADLILPPIVRRMPGRPIKARKRAEDEASPPLHAVSRRGNITKYRTCGATGHNAHRCKLPPKADGRIYPKKPRKKKQPSINQVFIH